MEFILDNIFEMLSNKSTDNSSENKIPKEILDQYPYGQFPIKYTKLGQETIRKQSENRYSYSDNHIQNTNYEQKKFELDSILPLIQIFSSQKKNPKDLMQLFSKILFKNNPDMQKLFSLIPNLNSKHSSIEEESFPNTNKIEISSLKKIE